MSGKFDHFKEFDLDELLPAKIKRKLIPIVYRVREKGSDYNFVNSHTRTIWTSFSSCNTYLQSLPEKEDLEIVVFKLVPYQTIAFEDLPVPALKRGKQDGRDWVGERNPMRQGKGTPITNQLDLGLDNNATEPNKPGV